MKELIARSVEECVSAAMKLREPKALLFIERSAELLAQVFKSGHKVIVAGNGGSLCDAAHFAEELTGFFRNPRRALPAIALSEPGHLTCTGNDLGFDWVFSRGVEAFGQPGDLFVGLTTSGNSPNIINAVQAAQKQGLRTILFLGKDGGKLKGAADIEWIVDGFLTSDRIQEAHMAAIHVMIEAVEHLLFSGHLSKSVEVCYDCS
ncbi:phosphoheptose isomerase [Waddlia chondrophila 2032/99]|uniref:Phosphoheptose isomerase n=1 Tax=Waddlia chondrophila 2032/99 TaxID=765953 RepID=F8LFB8_9BACT|nr:phosphoheptose isomerase [Waddlia chondrophila 2032/99]